MIDEEGFRANVGIILTNEKGLLFWARRVGQSSWQFPQGGIHEQESPRQAMFRELEEEVGLKEEHVRVLGSTNNWLRYRLPQRFIRQRQEPVCVGQKQIWFLLKLKHDAEDKVRFDLSDTPEFDGWRWVDYWEPLKEVIFFKRGVYMKALTELAPMVFPQGVPPLPRLPWANRRKTRSPYRRGRGKAEKADG